MSLPQPSSPPIRRRLELPAVDPLLAGAIALALISRIVFWAYTDRVWEDALITITHARNAVDGLGLIHHGGEGRVQGFTSPLSVLIPLAGEAIHSGGGLVLLRLVSLGAAVASVVFAYRLSALLQLARLPTVFVLAFVALDYHQILFGMAGMETQLAVAVLLGGFVYVVEERPWAAGIAFGLALLVRPDFVLWVAPGLAWFGLRSSRTALRRALAGTIALALPWFAFATAYYGSPIPETIKAKAASFASIPSLSEGPGAWISYLWHQPGAQTHLWKNLAPFIEDWRATSAPLSWWLSNIAFTMLVLAALGAWVTWRRTAWRPALVFMGLFTLYLIFGGRVDFFSWYVPPFMAALALLVGAALTHLGPLMPRIAGGLAIFLAAAFIVPLPFEFRLERVAQQGIEDQVRLPMARWLHAVVAPGQIVTSESAGYVGYYGKVDLHDFPGLTSPAALRVVKQIPRGHRSFPALAVRLQPEWIVARPFEVDEMVARDPRIPSRYVKAAFFGVPESRARLKAGPFEWQTVDREFYVLRRRDVKPLSGAPPALFGGVIPAAKTSAR